MTLHAPDRLGYRPLFDHPRGNRFSAEQVTAELASQGLALVDLATVGFIAAVAFGGPAVARPRLSPAD